MDQLVLEKGRTYSRSDLNNYIVQNDGILLEVNRSTNVFPTNKTQQLEIIDFYENIGSTVRGQGYCAHHSIKNLVIIVKSI